LMVLSGRAVRARRVRVLHIERDAAATRALGVWVFEEKAPADQTRVVPEHRAVQQPETPGIDEDLGAFRTLKHVIISTWPPFPGKTGLKAPARRRPSAQSAGHLLPFAAARAFFESVERRYLESQSWLPLRSLRRRRSARGRRRDHHNRPRRQVGVVRHLRDA